MHFIWKENKCFLFFLLGGGGGQQLFIKPISSVASVWSQVGIYRNNVTNNSSQKFGRKIPNALMCNKINRNFTKHPRIALCCIFMLQQNYKRSWCTCVTLCDCVCVCVCVCTCTIYVCKCMCVCVCMHTTYVCLCVCMCAHVSVPVCAVWRGRGEADSSYRTT